MNIFRITVITLLVPVEAVIDKYNRIVNNLSMYIAFRY